MLLAAQVIHHLVLKMLMVSKLRWELQSLTQTPFKVDHPMVSTAAQQYQLQKYHRSFWELQGKHLYWVQILRINLTGSFQIRQEQLRLIQSQMILSLFFMGLALVPFSLLV